MKKKITAILMAAALMVSLAACAGSNTASAVTESSTSSAASSTVSEKNDASSKPDVYKRQMGCSSFEACFLFDHSLFGGEDHFFELFGGDAQGLTTCFMP